MTRWLDEQEQLAWIGLLRLTSRLRAELHRQLVEDHGISLADYELLARLNAAPLGGLRVRDLMETLDWEQSRLSHHLARMEKRGLVERRECTKDRRGFVFVLTETGRSTLERAAPSHVEHVRRLFLDHLTPEQVMHLRDLTSTAMAGLSDRPVG
jgi:DNA-binding MarR family transcriptional regulator